jgi:hypothetical protein
MHKKFIFHQKKTYSMSNPLEIFSRFQCNRHMYDIICFDKVIQEILDIWQYALRVAFQKKKSGTELVKYILINFIIKFIKIY